MSDTDLRLDALLYTQRALLNLVPPELRAVEVAWDDLERCVHLRFVVDGEFVSREVWELFNEAHTHLVADMPASISVTWEADAQAAPSPRKLAREGVWVFMRYEPEANA